MQGYQFAHIETWSRKGVAKQRGKDKTVRKNGQRGWTADQIINEAAREPGASEHVGLARRKPLIIKGACDSFDALRDAHEDACSVKLTVPYTDRKTKKKKTRNRSVRQDTHTLYTAIVSLPITSAEALGDVDKMAESMEAFDLAIAFEKRRLEDAGGEFAMGVIHLDEKHIHLHIYGLDRQRGSTNGLHPGKAALDAFRARHGALSSKGSDLFQRSKRAYCDAMRDWQDDMHREALSKVGLCRFGPRRSRYSRRQWSARQREEEERAAAQETIATAAGVRADLEAASATLAEREDNVGEAIEALATDRENLKEERKAVAEKASRLDAGLATVEAMAEGYMEEREEGGTRIIEPTQKAVQSDARWRDLQAAFRRAPDEVGRIGGRVAASLRRLRKQAVEQARETARATAREELSQKFPALGAVHAFARDLISRLGTPQERQSAADTLEKAAKSEARDLVRFRAPGAGKRPGDDPQEL